jgi:hypothetical protein
MKSYKLLNFDSIGIRLQRFDNAFIPFHNDNMDYVRFKKEILADQAQLQDVDGNLMSASAAKAFVATLP